MNFKARSEYKLVFYVDLAALLIDWMRISKIKTAKVCII